MGQHGVFLAVRFSLQRCHLDVSFSLRRGHYVTDRRQVTVKMTVHETGTDGQNAPNTAIIGFTFWTDHSLMSTSQLPFALTKTSRGLVTNYYR